MEKRFIMAIDQGTTGTRVILFNKAGQIPLVCIQRNKADFSETGLGGTRPDRIL